MDIKIHNSKSNNTIFNTKNWIEYTSEIKLILEKQIPMDVVSILGDYESEYRCDNCGQTIGVEHTNYCHYCGQKLGW